MWKRSASRMRLVLLLGCGLAGCASGAGGGGNETQATPQLQNAWQARPVSMRVYPSTRFTAGEKGDVLLEARLELQDEMGDPVKGSGEFRLELLAENGLPGNGESGGRQLYLWRVPIYTLSDQKRFYDGITRTYLLRLRLDDRAIAEQTPTLHATFAPAAGARLKADATVRPIVP